MNNKQLATVSGLFAVLGAVVTPTLLAPDTHLIGAVVGGFVPLIAEGLDRAQVETARIEADAAAEAARRRAGAGGTTPAAPRG